MLGLDQVVAREEDICLLSSKKWRCWGKIDRGVNVSRLRREYGAGKSTIYDIKDQILLFVAESDSTVGISKRKTLCGPNNIDLDKVVYEWFRQRRSEGIHSYLGSYVHVECKILPRRIKNRRLLWLFYRMVAEVQKSPWNSLFKNIRRKVVCKSWTCGGIC
jgi:hypothetical protein